MKEKNELRTPAEIIPAEECPRCRAPNPEYAIEEQRFNYGEGEEAVELVARVPIRHCSNCGLEYFGEEAEAARHAAVCEHLNVLTPRQIRSLRMAYDLSRSDFARLTRLGEATIARWERGALIQSASNDRFLRLLQNPNVFEELRNLDGQPTGQSLSSEEYSPARNKFRVLKDVRKAKAAQACFRLRAS